jgi:hypothetical protein
VVQGSESKDIIRAHDMIRNALTGKTEPPKKTLVQQKSDFTAEGAPPPGHTSGNDVPATGTAAEPTPPVPVKSH